jgi:hypothetical protein
MPLIRKEGSLKGIPDVRNILFSAATIAALLFSGCAAKPGFNPTTSESNSVPGVALRGLVHGGQQPIVGAHICLYAANTTGYGAASVSQNPSFETSTSRYGRMRIR